MKNEFKYILRFLIIMICAIIFSLLLNHIGIGKENTLMVFIVGVLLVSTITKGYLYGALASIISVLSFNYFFTVPLYDFHISNENDIMLMIFFMIAVLISCNLTDRFQKQLIISRKNENISKQLYILSEKLLNVSGIDQILIQGSQYIEENLQLKAIASLQLKNISSSVFPITGKNRRLGSIEIQTKQKMTHDQIMIVKAAANQIGNALEREMTYLEQEKIKLAMEKEHMMNSMLKSISHDLRTPLTGIVGASQLMMKQSDLTDDEVRTLSKDIHDQAQWLTQMVENILNMSKIESGNLMIHKNIEVIDDLIREACQHVPELEHRHFSIESSDELMLVNVDGQLMIQVFVNLLDNAIKYTTTHDSIILSIQPIDDQVQIIVKDTGIGIQESIIDHIFDEFTTYPGVSIDSKKGIGLGLAICKAVILAHNGSIQAKNNPDKGASFIVTIPLEKELEMNE